MVETSLPETIFPFVCDDPKCKKEYQQWEFFAVAQERGFIWLKSKEMQLIGLTCPACNKTTIRKYSLKTSVLSNAEADGFKYYVKFIIRDQIDSSDEKPDGKFIIPNDIRYWTAPKAIDDNSPLPTSYPEWFEKKCLSIVSEKDLERMISYENECQKKVLPRIVSDRSIYHRLDSAFLVFDENFLTSQYNEDVNLSSNSAQISLVILGGIANEKYLSFGGPTNLTKEEYQDLTCQFMSEPSVEESIEYLANDIVKEYARKRNNIDFEQIWKTDFLDKYIKQAFYKPGYFRSKQYFQDKWYYEDIFGKIFKDPFPRIQESQLGEIITCDAVVKILGIPPIRLVGLINDGYLPAYRADYVYYNPKEEPMGPDIDPQKFLYLKSEIDELIMRNLPGLPKMDEVNKSETDVLEVPEIPDDQNTNDDAIEYARFLYEEKMWQVSIVTAMNIGLQWHKGKQFQHIDDLVVFVKESGHTIPISTITAIWEAISLEGVQQSDMIDAPHYAQYKKDSENISPPSSFGPTEKRHCGTLRKKTTQRKASIVASAKLPAFLITEDKILKRLELSDEIENIGAESGYKNEIKTAAINMIIAAVTAEPELAKYRAGDGNPNSERIDDAVKGSN